MCFDYEQTNLFNESRHYLIKLISKLYGSLDFESKIGYFYLLFSDNWEFDIKKVKLDKKELKDIFEPFIKSVNFVDIAFGPKSLLKLAKIIINSGDILSDNVKTKVLIEIKAHIRFELFEELKSFMEEKNFILGEEDSVLKER